MLHFYIVNYKFIVGEYETKCQLLFVFDRPPPAYQHPTYQEINEALEDYFENFYGENSKGESNCDRDGTVCFYFNGKVCIQFDPFPIEIVPNKGKWIMKEPQILTVHRVEEKNNK